MNEQLKFSWAHIIAFIAMIALIYTTFVGMAYWIYGQQDPRVEHYAQTPFIVASVVTAIIFVVTAITFLGAQMLKATARKFQRCIVLERICLCAAPVVLLLSLVPTYHFATVLSHNGEITHHFSSAVTQASGLFTNYEQYANERIKTYSDISEGVINNRNIFPERYRSYGFQSDRDGIQKDNMVATLRMLLLSKNYKMLSEKATAWISEANNGATTWNVFLLGNLTQIQAAIHSWDRSLHDYSARRLTNEDRAVETFEGDHALLAAIDADINAISARYHNLSSPTAGAWAILIVYALLLGVALLLPYLVQDRHSKSRVTLFTTKGDRHRGITLDGDDKSPKRRKHDYTSINID